MPGLHPNKDVSMLKHCSGLCEIVAFSGLLFLFTLTASLGSSQTQAGNQIFSAVEGKKKAFAN